MPLTDHPAEIKSKHRYEPERRQLTVMFCDLVDSITLSQQLEPEEFHEVLNAYQEVCGKVIRRFNGHIAQYLGDGILVYFGYPTAHEEDAQSAIRSGLAIVEEIQKLNFKLERNYKTIETFPLQVRVGVHTGHVVVGEVGEGEKLEHLAVGRVPYIASRVEEIAEPNEVLISSNTNQLIEGLFECNRLNSDNLRGVSSPMQLYRVIREIEVSSRFDVAITKGLTPLVGRGEEMDHLLNCWERVKGGRGQEVLVRGEAGIGKSRLVLELKKRLKGEPNTQLESQCLPYFKNSALYPIIVLVERIIGLRKEDSKEERFIKLEKFLDQIGFSLENVAPLFTSMLSLPLPDNYSPLILSPQMHRQKTLEALVDLVTNMSHDKPVVFIIEDLQWVDPSTIEMLSLLAEQELNTSIFTILTYRPDFISPWKTNNHISQITLGSLHKEQIGDMIDKVTGGKVLSDQLIHELISKSDGVPLFVEELTKTVLESGIELNGIDQEEINGSLTSVNIPMTLNDSLMARLDRLGTAKEVAQLGSVIGREFNYELFQAVSTYKESTLQRELGRLQNAEIIFQLDDPPNARYFFKHSLIQETAYGSLLKSKRKVYHKQIAKVLEDRFTQTADTYPELLAHHYTEAGQIKKAIPYWQKAGQSAVDRSAYVETIGHITDGLDLVETLPNTRVRYKLELGLLTTQIPALLYTKRVRDPELEKAYTRALYLCQQLGDTTHIYLVMYGLSLIYLHLGDLKKSYEIAERIYSLAEKSHELDKQIFAHFVLVENLCFMGKFVSMLHHAEKGIEIYSTENLTFEMMWFDPGLICFCYSALALWHLGYPDRALKMAEEALNIGKGESHPNSLMYSMLYTTYIYIYRKEVKLAQEMAEELIELTKTRGFPYILSMATACHGWALNQQEKGEDTIATINRCIDSMRLSLGRCFLPYFLNLFAEACWNEGKAEKALRIIAEALDIVNETGARYNEAELYRLKGENLLTLSQENQVEAEECFLKAIDVARELSEKSYELRAVMSMSRLLKKKGKGEEARKVLSEIYGWFTEGFDTLDLKEAKALLQDLS